MNMYVVNVDSQIATIPSDSVLKHFHPLLFFPKTQQSLSELAKYL